MTYEELFLLGSIIFCGLAVRWAWLQYCFNKRIQEFLDGQDNDDP